MTIIRQPPCLCCLLVFKIYSEVKEAAPGFEPGITVLQTAALPLGYAAILKESKINKRAGDGI